MKKLLEKFVKPVKSKDSSYRLNKNNLPESSGCFQVEEPSNLDAYKNFEFDSNCNGNSAPIESQTKNESAINSPPALKFSLSSDGKSDETPNVEMKGRRHSDKCRSNSERLYSDCRNPSLNDVFSGLEEKVKKLEPKDVQRSGSHTYVININNSKNFYVGSRKTINICDPAKDDLEKKKQLMDSSIVGNDDNYLDELVDLSMVENDDVDELLDSEKKLTEENITVISMYLNHQWKEFGKTLGFEELFLEELYERNDNEPSITVYDLLRKYLDRFPNTSLGFMAYVLKKIQSTGVIEKLVENKRF